MNSAPWNRLKRGLLTGLAVGMVAFLAIAVSQGLRNPSEVPNTASIAAISIVFALVGGLAGFVWGTIILPIELRGVCVHALVFTLAVTVMGFILALQQSPRDSATFQIWWLRFIVPTAVIVGSIVGFFRAKRT